MDHAGKGSLDELRNECKRVRAAADPDPEGTHRRIHTARHVRTRTDVDGTWVMTVRGHRRVGGPDPGRVCGTGPTASSARPTGPAGANPPRPTCSMPSSSSAPTPAPPTEPPRCPRAPTPRSSPGSTGPPCSGAAPSTVRHVRSPGSGPSRCSVVRELCQDAFVAAVLTKGTDICSVTHLGRRHTALQVTALQWRDPECARLGCANTVRLENDHREDWADTHVTRVDQIRPALPPRPQAQDRKGLDARRRHRQTPPTPTRPPRPSPPESRPLPHAGVTPRRLGSRGSTCLTPLTGPAPATAQGGRRPFSIRLCIYML